MHLSAVETTMQHRFLLGSAQRTLQHWHWHWYWAMRWRRAVSKLEHGPKQTLSSPISFVPRTQYSRLCVCGMLRPTPLLAAHRCHRYIAEGGVLVSPTTMSGQHCLCIATKGRGDARAAHLQSVVCHLTLARLFIMQAWWTFPRPARGQPLCGPIRRSQVAVAVSSHQGVRLSRDIALSTRRFTSVPCQVWAQ
ncbi:hypothetical protein T440DRAFT_222235 [Plenodomus tracheiphilus IPT5]|uniref:Uncharacterized protein n=1 Tax=Plenodomus tracheiphilus IPT5 TaxID=1408161 RepID=A0A6A7AX23_9PLEO|nr:hypothetical protein T440DRAFT_222235 [Plenodomus tracheiphilus IPT5]